MIMIDSCGTVHFVMLTHLSLLRLMRLMEQLIYNAYGYLISKLSLIGLEFDFL